MYLCVTYVSNMLKPSAVFLKLSKKKLGGMQSDLTLRASILLGQENIVSDTIYLPHIFNYIFVTEKETQYHI